MVDLNEINAFLDSFYNPLDPHLIELRKGEKEYVPYIRKQTETLIGILLGLHKPKRILELGTAIGYSAIFMAKKCPECMIFTVERNREAAEEARKNIEAFGLSNRIRVLEGDCLEVLESLKEQGEGEFDLLFIDAAKSHYKEFIEESMALLNKGALILSDDVFQRGITISEKEDPEGKHKTSSKNMREYLNYITSSPIFETSILNVGDGLAITIYKG